RRPNELKLSLIIPCYNEEKNLPLLIERLKSIMSREDVEVILVDNGSTDGSSQVLSKLLEGQERIRSIRGPVNEGYGYGILSVLRAAGGGYLGWSHADMQTDPNDALRALEVIEYKGNPEKMYVKGRRYGRPLFDVFFMIGMSCFETLYLGKPLWDINAQPNIFPRSFFDSWREPPHDFSLDLYAYYEAHRTGLEVAR